MTFLKPSLSYRKCEILRSLFGFVLLISIELLYSQQLPVGYIQYYSQKGTNSGFIKSLVLNQPHDFEIGNDKTSTLLNPFPEDSLADFLPPSCRGIIADKIFGEFIAEFDYKIHTGIISGESGFYFLAPVKSNSTYYAIAFSDDSLSFYFVREGNVDKLSCASGCKINAGWNKVRIERNILTRSLQITMNGDIIHPITFTDRNLVMGFVGFGTQSIPSYLRNVNIWAPTAITDTLYHGE